MDHTIILFFGMLLEICFDWPKSFFKLIKHPVVWIGYFISLSDATLNKSRYSNNIKKVLGFFTVLICVSINLLFFFIISDLIEDFIHIEILYTLIVWGLLCSRSLYSHIKKIEDHIKKKKLTEARICLSFILGRETKSMKKKAIIISTLESL